MGQIFLKKVYFYLCGVRVFKVVNLLRVFQSDFFSKGARLQSKMIEITPKFQIFLFGTRGTQNKIYEIWAACSSEISQDNGKLRFRNTPKEQEWISKTVKSICMIFLYDIIIE